MLLEDQTMGATNKTIPTKIDVTDFINQIEDGKRQQEIETLVKATREILKEEPVIWGTSIIGFGTFAYRGRSGRSGIWMKVGIASRKAAISLYLSFNIMKYESILKRLGKYTTGAGCLYLKRLEDIDLEVLKELIAHASADIKPLMEWN
jgi:nucleoid DNA-binding protein